MIMSPFESLPNNSRVWVYQANRPLSDAEVQAIQNSIADFVGEWSSHSRNVIAAGDVLHNLFIVLMADESAFSVSGCSIDSSVNFIRSVENEFGIELFDRFTTAYLDGNQIKMAGKEEFQQLIDNGMINEKTIVFNNVIQTKKEFGQGWKVPLTQSWHTRLFKLPA